MERVEYWVENEMRRIDPEAYPEAERPINPEEQDARLQRALEEQADAARAAQGEVPEDFR
jgi:hypothetical protein